MNRISNLEFKIYCVLVLLLTIVVCFNIYLNFIYVVKLRDFNNLTNEQSDIIDDNLRLLAIIYELESIDRIESLCIEDLNLRKRDNKDINIFVE